MVATSAGLKPARANKHILSSSASEEEEGKKRLRVREEFHSE